MHKVASSVGSFIPLLWDFGSWERILPDSCHQKTSLLGTVASHQPIKVITDWIVGKVIHSHLEAVGQWICSERTSKEDKNAQNTSFLLTWKSFWAIRRSSNNRLSWRQRVRASYAPWDFDAANGATDSFLGNKESASRRESRTSPLCDSVRAISSHPL